MPLAEDMAKAIPTNAGWATVAQLREVDEANARIFALECSDIFSALPAERQQYWHTLALSELRWLRPGEELSPMCQAALAPPTPPQRELFTPTELDAAMTKRDKSDDC